MRWTLQMPPVVLWGGAGLFMGVAFLHQYLWWTMFLGLLLFIYILRRTHATEEGFYLGWLLGSVKMFVVMSWLWSIYPLTWIGITSTPLQISIIFVYWIFVALSLGFGVGAASALFIKIRAGRRLWYFLSFPLLLIFGEAVGAFIYSLLILGPGSELTSALSVGHTGYVLVDHSILKYVAKIGGVYTLTLIAGVVTGFIFYIAQIFIFQRLYKKILSVLLGTLLILSGFVGIPIPQESGEEKIAVFTTSFDSDVLNSEDVVVLYKKQQLLVDALNETLQHNPSAIILPETSAVSEIFMSEKRFLAFLNERTQNDLLFIDSVRTEEGGVLVSRAKIFDTKTNSTYMFDKQYLVALGEYIPYLFFSAIKLLPSSEKTEKVLADRVLRPGIDQKTLSLPEHVPNVLFCYESVSPWAVRSITKNKEEPKYVAHTISHGWFSGPMKFIFWYQLDSMLKTQALWSGVHIIKAANMATSAHYLPSGQRGELKKIYQNSHVQVDLVEI